jgi:hypothetical protein
MRGADGIRVLAWVLVIVGLSVMAIGSLGVHIMNENAEAAAHEALRQSVDLRLLNWAIARMARGLPLVQPTSFAIPLGIGAGVTAFGVLLLAIRPPERKEGKPMKEDVESEEVQQKGGDLH